MPELRPVPAQDGVLLAKGRGIGANLRHVHPRRIGPGIGVHFRHRLGVSQGMADGHPALVTMAQDAEHGAIGHPRRQIGVGSHFLWPGIARIDAPEIVADQPRQALVVGQPQFAHRLGAKPRRSAQPGGHMIRLPVRESGQHTLFGCHAIAHRPRPPAMHRQRPIALFHRPARQPRDDHALPHQHQQQHRDDHEHTQGAEHVPRTGIGRGIRR